MAKHHTAFFEFNNERKAEESGGGPLGLAPLFDFLGHFNHHFSPRTRPSFHKRCRQYLAGLFQLDRARNLERIDERVEGSEYQSLHHFLTHSPWDDQAVCDQIAQEANRILGVSPDTCLIIDSSGIPKKGSHSVGVGRMYCGNRGKVDNCQVGVFSSLARGRDACLINKRLYLPRHWCNDPAACDKAGIPMERRGYKTNLELALELVDDADHLGLQYAWIGMDAEFSALWLLAELDRRGKPFLADIRSNTRVYPTHPYLRRASKKFKNAVGALHLQVKPMPVEAVRKGHGNRRWRRREIRDSSRGIMAAEFLHKQVWLWDGRGDSPPKRWHLIIRRTRKQGSDEWQYKYSLSNAPAGTSTQRLAYQQAQRFWVEQAIKDAKDSLGLDEYQARKWRAWHHHMAMTMLASLYVLKTRLENRQSFPLLSIRDVREVLESILPRKARSVEALEAQIRSRHRRRVQSYQSFRVRHGTAITRLKASYWGDEVNVTM